MSDLVRCEVSPILSGADELVGIQITLETSRARTVLHASKADLEKALARGGLALVPAADVPTPEERAVLEACAALPFEFVAEESQQPDLRIGTYTLCAEYAPELAALCRAIRAAKEAKGE